jgi:hypothetical protein
MVTVVIVSRLAGRVHLAHGNPPPEIGSTMQGLINRLQKKSVP